jgi:hypothetical protein
MVYQNGNGEMAHLRLEEASMGIEASKRKQTTRRLLFTGVIVTLLLAFGVLAGLVIRIQNGHQNGPSSILPEAVATNALNKLDDMSSSSSLLPGCESTLLILRHCEKEGPSVTDNHRNQHCSYLGHERAHFLPTLFGPGLWPAPSLLYAFSDKRGHHVNYREIETLMPLATKLGLEINSVYSNEGHLADDFFTHLSSGAMCGQTALVSWKHSLIPDLARALGCADCPEVFPDEFDPVWQLKFVHDVLGTDIFQQRYEIVNDDKRELKKHKASSSPHQWTVFSTVTKQNFDPLIFSHTSGDYEGSLIGGKWMSPQEL